MVQHKSIIRLRKIVAEKLFLLVCVGTVLLQRNVCQADIIIDGKINVPINQTISKLSPRTIKYILPPDPHMYFINCNQAGLAKALSYDDKLFNVKISTDSTDFSHPLLITVQQRDETTALEIPYSFDDNDDPEIPKSVIYRSVATSLCFNAKSTGHKNVSVSLRTSNPSEITSSVTLTDDQNLYLALDKKYSVDVSPTHPTYRRFKFGDETLKYVRLEATSEKEDAHCLILSIQTPFCPIFDKESNVQYQGRWQTMSTKAATTIKKDDFSTGFFVVLVVNKNDIRCGNDSDPTDQRLKKVTLFLKSVKTIDEKDVYSWLAIFLPALVALVVGIVTYLSLFFFRIIIEREMLKIAANHGIMDSIFLENGSRRRNCLDKQSGGHHSTSEHNQENDSFQMVDITSGNDGALNAGDIRSPFRKIKTLKEYCAAIKNLCSCKEEPNDFSPEIDIAGLIKLRNSEKCDVRRLKRYLGVAVAVAVFYAVPVYQLIIQYFMVYRSGNYDLCYYNSLCAIPYWKFMDFNHICSNFDYIIFGVAFIFIVRKKRDMHLEIVDKVTDEILRNFQGQSKETSQEDMKSKIKIYIENHGTPLHYEFYYTLAFVLIMEGFMSAAYHICPNQSTFQFDTCFMYVIAVLGILKLYQNRHPIYLGPVQVFLVVSLFQLFIVLCLTAEQYPKSAMVHLLKIVFTLIHVIWNGYFSIRSYTAGQIKYDGTEGCNNWKLSFKQLWPIFLNAHPRRIISPLIMSIIHAFIIPKHYNDDFANYLLFLLLGTFIGHTLCYSVMKISTTRYDGEWKRWALCQSVFYFVLLAVVGGFALHYFHAELTTWNKTSAQSREGNQECSLFSWIFEYPFYDQHDIWHFLSAGAVFFYYMFLLTLDDGIIATHQSLIPVF